MRHFPKIVVACAVGLLSGLPWVAGVAQTPPAPSDARKPIDVPQLFATTCGWCHSDGGRTAGKGPQLMDTKRSDDYIRMRIKNGKEGAMPAFKGILSDADIDDIIHYVRTLKPD